ncbi:MAG: O-antigen ligase family protein [Acidobacteriaceae bacterium]|nr:O-antigen ligase family protein [Acidobacteriaceae bacterium]
MAVADVKLPSRLYLTRGLQQRIVAGVLFCLLSGFTLCTLDGGEIAQLVISAGVLLFSAYALLFGVENKMRFTLPVACLLAMTLYGVVQTLWLPQKIVYDGWLGVLFWLTVAAVVFLATHVFEDDGIAAQFRSAFVIFGSAVCLLDLLEQASQTNKYYGLIQSKFATINGPFAYWNNFAQFVELFLPMTLWLGISRRRLQNTFLGLSALQIAAVIASGSRAGTVLVIVELIAVILLAYARNRKRSFLAAAGTVVLLSGVFVYAAGFDTLFRKLQQKDQLQVRREINRSSLEMIRARPLTGWGLNTYVPVYRMFAHYDDGTYVNRAHNDWLQFAAEGGIPFAALMALVFFWSIRPAIRSVWGLGVIAVGLHALVDYPFARLGVCAWYFALIGMLAVWREHESSGVRRRKALRESAA